MQEETSVTAADTDADDDTDDDTEHEEEAEYHFGSWFWFRISSSKTPATCMPTVEPGGNSYASAAETQNVIYRKL